MNCTKPKKYNISNNGDGKEMEIERIFDKKEDNGKVLLIKILNFINL